MNKFGSQNWTFTEVLKVGALAISVIFCLSLGLVFLPVVMILHGCMDFATGPDPDGSPIVMIVGGILLGFCWYGIFCIATGIYPVVMA